MKIFLHNTWSDQAAEGLSKTLRDDEDFLADQINTGIAQLWEIDTDRGKSWMITRVEQDSTQTELVICCFQGCDLKHVTKHIYQCAEKQGFDSIRYHTQRAGLNRLVIDLGFAPYETVYRKVLKR